MWRRYLLWFAQEHVDFRHAEMNSIISVFNIPVKFIEKPCIQKPYWVVELPTEECAKKIASRSVLLKNCVELWSKAKSQSQLHSNLQSALLNNTEDWIKSDSFEENSDKDVCPRSLIDACCSADISFKVEMETYNKHYTMKEKVQKIKAFDYLPLTGSVNLRNPDIKLAYFEFYGDDCNNVPDEPFDLFFGKWIADGQRSLIQQLSLKKRQFIGNTSMDATLALVMANQAQIAPGDRVLDPFVGSGSILVAAAYFGGYVWGSDIDFMMLHGRTRPSRVGEKQRSKDESVLANMHQYGLSSRYIDVVVADSSRPLWRHDATFDAIVTDPPYGVREPTERIGIERENYTLAEHHLPNHIPAKVEYDLNHMYEDLMDFAASHLGIGKRLVCWYPLVREEYTPSCLPSHPCLELVANSEQVLSKLTSRRLLTYQKIKHAAPYNPAGPRETATNFRDKYFAVGEMTRKERREKRAEELNGRHNKDT